MFFWRGFARLWEGKIALCQFTKVHQWNPSESRHWSFPSRSLPLNKSFSFISALALRRRANARNVSFRISLRWLTYIVNSVDKTKLSRWRNCSTALSSDRSDGQKATIPHNYQGRPSFTSVYFRPTRDEGINASYRQQFCTCQKSIKELNILSRTEVGSNLYLGDSEDESDILCPWLWNWPAVSSTHPARTDAKAATASLRERW